MKDDIKRVTEGYFIFLFLRNSFFLALTEEVQSVFYSITINFSLKFRVT